MGSPIAFQEIYKASMEDFVIPSYESAVNTTIQNRALLTRSLKAIGGVERIHTRSGLNLLPNEFGPSSEPVYEDASKNAKIRFVGSWSHLSDTNGPRPLTLAINSYVEITFYGTGLNLMTHIVSGQDVRATLDGGAEGANLFPATVAAILNGRNTNSNMVVPVYSGLSLDWHTVRIRNNHASNGFSFNGVEVLNQRTDIGVYSGSGISNGSIQGLSALTASSFTAGISGTRGARVIKYILNGVVSQAVQEVDATTQYFTAATHANEEVVRKINFRDFQANRSDDFQSLAGVSADKALTLDDGVTTLVINDSSVTTFSGASEGIVGNSATISRLQITFVGTGLDFQMQGDGSAYAGTFDLHVDGTRVISGANWSTHFGANRITRNQKVVSGLPYGTHTVQMQIKSAGTSPCVSDFIIYQPKKPAIPAGALEYGEFNVLGNFVFKQSASDADGGVDQTSVSQGVIRVQNTRGIVYVGASWNISAVDGNGVPSGFRASNNNSGHYLEYTFWGTGFDLRNVRTTAATTLTLAVNGSTLTAANFPTATFTSSSGFTTPFNSSTGVLTLTGASTIAAHGFACTGLPLNRYTIRVTQNTANAWNFESLDIITPIHINDSSLKVGFQSLKSLDKYSPEKSIANTGPDLSKAKAWVIYDAANSIILNSYNIAACLAVATGRTNIYFQKPFKNSNYVCIGGVNEGSTSSIGLAFRNQYPTSIEFRSTNATNTLLNNIIMVAFFGELIDE